MYWPAPRMNRGSSLRLTEWPIPPTSGVVWSVSVISSLPAQLAGAASMVSAASTGADSPTSSWPDACWMALTMFT